MGRFCAILVLLAACGDNLPGPTPTAPRGGTAAGAGQAIAPTTYLEPEVCGDLVWNGVATDSAAQVSVAAAGANVEMLAVPLAGGTVTSYALDAADKAALDTTKVPFPGTITSIAVSQVGTRLVATAVTASDVQVELLDPTLQNPIEIAKLPGTPIAQPAMLTADGFRIVPYATSTGVAVQAFDNAWQPTTSFSAAMTDPVTSITATQLGQAAILGWSTSSECYVGLAYGPTKFGPGAVAHASYPCPSPRVAVDTVAGSADLVFEAPDGIRVMHLDHMQMGGGSNILRTQATSPRVLFDGTRTWVSYIDARGGVAVGFLSGDNQLISTAIPGLQPQRGAYELAMYDGAPWVFALDAGGYSAHRLCVAAH